MPAIPSARPSPKCPASPASSPTPASRGPWLALLLIAAGLLVANRRPLADAVAGPMATLLGGREVGGGFAGQVGLHREAWPVVPAPGPMVILGPAAPAGMGAGGVGRRMIGAEWGPGEIGD